MINLENYKNCLKICEADILEIESQIAAGDSSLPELLYQKHLLEMHEGALQAIVSPEKFVPSRRKKLEAAELRRLYEIEKLSLVQIAQIKGVTKQAIHTRCQRAGIELRKPDRPWPSRSNI